MALTITRTAWTDDDGSGTTGTVINNAAKTELYNQIDAVLAQIAANAGQLAFPATQSPSADANTLDDYEEGSWTPVLGGAGGTSGQTYTTQVGRYVKIGQLVFVGAQVVLSNKGTITGNVQVSGLPFTVLNAVDLAGQIMWHSLATTWVHLNLRLQANATTAEVLGATAAATSTLTALVTADVNNTTTMYFSACYRASQ